MMATTDRKTKRLARLLVSSFLACFAVGGAWAEPVLQQVSPSPTTYDLADFYVFVYSGTGDVTAQVAAVDINLTGDRSNTSGCEAADFAGFTAGFIALIQRGVCFFEQKAENAAAAGASAVLIFNQGNTVDREGVVMGTLNETYTGGIPVIGLAYDLGATFASIPNLVVHMKVAAEDVPTSLPVPEPSTLALLGLGLVGLGVLRRWPQV